MLPDLIPIIAFVLLLIIIIIALRKPKEDLHSHWSSLLPDFKFSTKEFYTLVRSEMISHDISKMSFVEVSLKTSSVVSAKRLYLRFKWQDYRYDLCFAPFGDGCFVSWWLIFEPSGGEAFLTNIPLIGGWIKKAFYKKTYYKIDTASMFMTYAQHSVLAVIDEITKNSGVRLSQEERKPIMKSIFDR